jgi:hypothetical protein
MINRPRNTPGMILSTVIIIAFQYARAAIPVAQLSLTREQFGATEAAWRED